MQTRRIGAARRGLAGISRYDGSHGTGAIEEEHGKTHEDRLHAGTCRRRRGRPARAAVRRHGRGALQLLARLARRTPGAHGSAETRASRPRLAVRHPAGYSRPRDPHGRACGRASRGAAGGRFPRAHRARGGRHGAAGLANLRGVGARRRARPAHPAGRRAHRASGGGGRRLGHPLHGAQQRAVGRAQVRQHPRRQRAAARDDRPGSGRPRLRHRSGRRLRSGLVRAQRRGRARVAAFPRRARRRGRVLDREDRMRRGGGELRGHHRSGRRRDGGAWRLGRGGAGSQGAAHPEGDHPRVEPCVEAGDHGNPDAGLYDTQPASYAPRWATWRTPSTMAPMP